jgi:hypothetical protein
MILFNNRLNVTAFLFISELISGAVIGKLFCLFLKLDSDYELTAKVSDHDPFRQENTDSGQTGGTRHYGPFRIKLIHR